MDIPQFYLLMEVIIFINQLKEVFENYATFNEFNSQYDLFKEFLRFSKKFFSNNKEDKNNNPSLKSCLLIIPGSINSNIIIKSRYSEMKWL